MFGPGERYADEDLAKCMEYHGSVSKEELKRIKEENNLRDEDLEMIEGNQKDGETKGGETGDNLLTIKGEDDAQNI